MADSKIIERIRKLLELADAERGGTEAERNLAAERAHELMLKHNLEQGDLTGQSAPGDIGSDSTRIEGSMAFFQVELASAIGRVSFVDVFYIKRARFAWDMTMLGRADNVTYVQTMCATLIPWLEQEQRAAYADMKEVDPTIRPRSFGMAFYSGAIATIQRRLAALRATTFEGTGEELVKNEAAALDKYKEENNHKIKPDRKRGHGDMLGLGAGAQAGERANLLQGKELN